MFNFSSTKDRKREVQFSMAIGNEDLIHKCFPKHSRIRTENEIRQETVEEGKKRGVSMERSKADTKERGPDGLSLPNQNTILINITWSCNNINKSCTEWPHRQGGFLAC